MSDTERSNQWLFPHNKTSLQISVALRKFSYQLSCSHCCVHESKSRVIFKDDHVGPSDVPKENLKRVKKPGNNSKGATMYNIFSLFILFPIDTHNAYVFTMYLKRCEEDGL